jgi:hypothetical protein
MAGRKSDDAGAGAGDQAQDPDVTAGPSEGEGGGLAVWELRLADLEYWRTVQDAVLEHQLYATAAMSEYLKEIRGVAAEAAAKELDAVEAAVAETKGPEVALERSAQALQQLHARINEVRSEASRQVRAAQRVLADAQQRSWMDALDKQADAFNAHQNAVREAQPAFTGAFAGDEGGGIVTRPEFAFETLGDEGGGILTRPAFGSPAFGFGPPFGGVAPWSPGLGFI